MSRQRKTLEVERKFGRWTVIGPCFSSNHETFAPCQCECGSLNNVKATKLRSGRSRGCHSCMTVATVTHGESTPPTPEYYSWRAMTNRCTNPNDISWKNYGGRGIVVCPQWLGPNGYQTFLADMGRRPGPEYQIERRDNNGDYTPDNCYWTTPKVQSRNRRSNRPLTLNGETLPMAAWAERLGVNRSMLYYRLRNGWDVQQTLTTPRRERVTTT